MATLMDIFPNNPFVGPPLPRGVNLTWSDFLKTIKSEASGLSATLQPGGPPIILPDIAYLIYKSISAAASDAVATPGKVAEWTALLEKRVASEGLFPQYAVGYANFSPPPLFYDYKCKKCRFWGPNNNLPDLSCKLVADRISPQGWCAIWLPPDSYQPFSWTAELLKGEW